MYDFIMYYTIFAVATGVTSYFTIYRPILVEIFRDEDIEETPLRFTITIAFILIFLCTVAAPLMFKTAITGPNESLKQIIRDRFTKGIEK